MRARFLDSTSAPLAPPPSINHITISRFLDDINSSQLLTKNKQSERLRPPPIKNIPFIPPLSTNASRGPPPSTSTPRSSAPHIHQAHAHESDWSYKERWHSLASSLRVWRWWGKSPIRKTSEDCQGYKNKKSFLQQCNNLIRTVTLIRLDALSNHQSNPVRLLRHRIDKPVDVLAFAQIARAVPSRLKNLRRGGSGHSREPEEILYAFTKAVTRNKIKSCWCIQPKSWLARALR